MKYSSSYAPTSTPRQPPSICIKCDLILINNTSSLSHHSVGNQSDTANIKCMTRKKFQNTSYTIFQSKNNYLLKYRLYEVSIPNRDNHISHLKSNLLNVTNNKAIQNSQQLQSIRQMYAKRQAYSHINVIKALQLFLPQYPTHCKMTINHPMILTEHAQSLSSLSPTVLQINLSRIVLDWISGIKYLSNKMGKYFQLTPMMLGVSFSNNKSIIGKIWFNECFYSIQRPKQTYQISKQQIFEQTAVNVIKSVLKQRKIRIQGSNFEEIKHKLKNLQKKSGRQVKHKNISLYCTMKKAKPLTGINLQPQCQNQALNPSHEQNNHSNRNKSKERKINVVTPSQRQHRIDTLPSNPFSKFIGELEINKNDSNTNLNRCRINTLQNKDNSDRKYLVLSGKKNKEHKKVESSKQKQTKVQQIKRNNKSPYSNTSVNSKIGIHKLNPSSERQDIGCKRLQIKNMKYKITFQNHNQPSKLHWKNQKQALLLSNTHLQRQDQNKMNLFISDNQKKGIYNQGQQKQKVNILKESKQPFINRKQRGLSQNIKIHQNLGLGDQRNPIQKIRKRMKSNHSIKSCQQKNKNKIESDSIRNSINSYYESEKNSQEDSSKKRKIQKGDLIKYQSYYDRIITQPLPHSQSNSKSRFEQQLLQAKQREKSSFLENITPIKPLGVIQHDYLRGKELELQLSQNKHKVNMQFDYKKWKQLYSQNINQYNSEQSEEQKKNSFSWEISERDEEDSISFQNQSSHLDNKNYSQISGTLFESLKKHKQDIEVIDSYITIADQPCSSNKKYVYEESLILKGLESDRKNHLKNLSQTLKKNLELNQNMIKTQKTMENNNQECLSPIHKLSSKELQKKQDIFSDRDGLFTLKPVI